MKKSVCLCIAVWILLTASVLVIYTFARSVHPAMETPEIISITSDGSNVTLKWNPVEYVTSYSIHRKAAGSNDWELVKAVGSGTTTFVVENATAGDLYCVRSCNYSLGTYHWSDFSAPVSAEKGDGAS